VATVRKVASRTTLISVIIVEMISGSANLR
jgi:hypothetical protein